MNTDNLIKVMQEGKSVYSGMKNTISKSWNNSKLKKIGNKISDATVLEKDKKGETVRSAAATGALMWGTAGQILFPAISGPIALAGGIGSAINAKARRDGKEIWNAIKKKF